jgi:hypothetical protein
MTQLRSIAVALLVAASVTSCGGAQRPTGVAAVLTGEASRRLTPQLALFLEALPAEVQAFGYVDFGGALLRQAELPAEYQPMIGDFAEMAQRRWRIDINKLRGVGVAVLADKTVMFAELGDGVQAAGASFQAKALGALSVLGEPAAVDAMIAASARGKLLKAHPEWLRAAMQQAAGKPAFMTVAVESLDAANQRTPLQTATRYATAVVAFDSGTVHILAKPGKASELRTFVDQSLQMLRTMMAGALAQAAGDAPESVLLRLLIEHHGKAMLDGLQVSGSNDELLVALPWRAPTLPAATRAPELSQRIVTPDEWAVLQLDLGRPLLETIVAMTDVVGAPIDRAKVLSVVRDLASKALNVPQSDPRGATVSVGGMSALVSVHASGEPAPRGPFALARGALVGAGTPWGMVVTVPSMEGVLKSAMGAAARPLALASSSKLAAGDDVMMRAFVDLDRAPGILKVMAGNVPLRSIELTSSITSFEADLVAQPGKAAEVERVIGLFKGMMESTRGSGYANRRQASAVEEAVAIMQYHQVQMFNKVMTPKVQGDRLTFSYTMSAALARSVGTSAAVAMAGALAAVALPAYMDYMKRSRQVQAAP